MLKKCIHRRILRNIMYDGFHKNILNIDNNQKCVLSSNIIMISEDHVTLE